MALEISGFRHTVVDKERNIEISSGTPLYDDFTDQYSMKYSEGRKKFYFCMVINEESKANSFQRFMLGKKTIFTSYVVESTIKSGILSGAWQWVPELGAPQFTPFTPITDMQYKEIIQNTMEAARLISNSYIDPSIQDFHIIIRLARDWTEVPCVQKFLSKGIKWKSESPAKIFLFKLFKKGRT